MTRPARTAATGGPLRRALALGILPLVLLLGACAGLPTSETVEQGLPVQGAPLQDVQALPVGPEEDAGPEEIVASFLRASGSFADDHEVARSFLTTDLARQWRPTSGVLIHEGQVELSSTSTGQVQATVSVRGRVDDDGYLVESAGQARETDTFEMAQVDGQWRISAFPEEFGLWLPESTFDQQYRPDPVNYIAQSGNHLIPDVRWFPRGDGLPTSLARAQIGPVPDYLDGAAHTGISEDLNLVANVVPVDPATSVATVDLRGLPLGISAVQQRELLAQFTATLRPTGSSASTGVSGVVLRSAGRTVEVEGIELPVTDPTVTGFSRAGWSIPYGLLRTNVALTPVSPLHYQLEEDLSVDDTALPRVPIKWEDLAADPAVQEFAAVSSVNRDSVWRWRDDTEVTMEGIGKDLTAPAFDRSGGLWVAGRSTTGPRVWVIDTSERLSRAVAKPLEADWMDDDEQIRHLRPAADDHRAVIVLEDLDSGQVRIGVTGIVRDRDGEATSLTEPYWTAPTLTSITGVVWSSQTELFVLGQQDSDSADRPYLVHLGGWLEPMRSVSQATDVRAVPTGEGTALIVLSDGGRIYTQERTEWTIARNGHDVVIPGT